MFGHGLGADGLRRLIGISRFAHVRPRYYNSDVREGGGLKSNHIAIMLLQPECVIRLLLPCQRSTLATATHGAHRAAVD